MNRREFFQRVGGAWHAAKASWVGQAAEVAQNPDWADEPAPAASPESAFRPGLDDFDPERYPSELLAFNEDSKCVPWLMRQIEEKKAVIDRGWVFEARTNWSGRMLKECEKGRRLPYKLTPIKGHEAFMEAVERSKAADRFREDTFGQGLDFSNTRFDLGQYTEYAPLLGGYFFAQQYLTDMLKGMAYAFEAWNHNPLAHRIVDGLAQYTLGRRFTWFIKDEKKEQVWNRFCEKHKIKQKLSKFWLREQLIFGEQFMDKNKWKTLHPATVWEIVTDPDDFSDVYYYYRSYPTAWQMFTGYKVPSVPGAKEVPAQRYVVEQLPYTQIIHSKRNCTSFEKRGRSSLYGVLGWLKRIKDTYNAQAIKEQMEADYVWDVEIKGGPGDVAKYAAQYTPLAQPGSTHFHNDAVKRTPLSVPTTGRGAGSETSNNLLAFIATHIGLPKDFFNVISTGGGNRATALVAAEPFTKVVEDAQADVEHLLHQMFDAVMEQAGMDHRDEDIEFTFPSVAKDTTTETVKNIVIGEAQGYITKERAATMYTQEMAITAYVFEDEQKKIKNEVAKGISNIGQPQPPDGRMGGDGIIKDQPTEPQIPLPDQPASDGSVPDDANPNHGQARTNLKRQMNRI